MKWEYKVEDIEIPAEGVLSFLNQQGQDGWELCESEVSQFQKYETDDPSELMNEFKTKGYLHSVPTYRYVTTFKRMINE